MNFTKNCFFNLTLNKANISKTREMNFHGVDSLTSLNKKSLIGVALFCSAIVLTGCEAKKGMVPLEEASLEIEDEVQAENVVAKTDEAEKKQAALENTEVIGSGHFINPKTSAKSKTTAFQNTQLDNKQKFDFNFQQVELAQVVEFILKDRLGENYMLSPDVTGVFALDTVKPLSKEELLPALEIILQMNDAVIFKNNGIYQIEKKANAKKFANAPTIAAFGKNLPLGYQIKIIPLEFVSVDDMAKTVEPLLSEDIILKKDVARNLLIVAGNEQELANVLETVKIFDVNYMDGFSFGLFPLKNIDAEKMIEDLEEIFNKGEENPLTGVLRFVAIDQLRAVLVITHQPRYIETVKTWIARLDKARPETGKGLLNIYRLKYSAAEELAETLNEVLGNYTSSEKSEPLTVSPTEEAVTLTADKADASDTPQTSSQKSNYSGANIAANHDLSNVRVMADKPNNALIVMATPGQYKTLKQFIEELDRMPKQVLIDVRIFAVKLTDDLQYGVKWLFHNKLSRNYEGVGLFELAQNTALGAATSGFSYAFLNSSNIELVVNALAEKGNVKVLSEPSVMVLNNHEAIIKVGDQVPVRVSESVNNNGTGIQTSQIEMRETGVFLTVTPRVNSEDGLILDIDQQVNSASISTTSNIDSPTILQRQIRSTISAMSGETIVLGGLISKTESENKSGIPLLKDIPLLGALFSSTSDNEERDELIMLIKPVVVNSRRDARKVTNEFQRKLPEIFYDESKKEETFGDRFL